MSVKFIVTDRISVNIKNVEKSKNTKKIENIKDDLEKSKEEKENKKQIDINTLKKLQEIRINNTLSNFQKKIMLENKEKIKELNGGRSVSAVFVVGGGGKVNGYTTMLSDKLGIQAERVALRGKEVMQKIDFLDSSIEKDSLLVTPIGICLNFYEQNNNFVFVSFNGEKIKLYDNKHLKVTDAAIQAHFPNDGFFPKRGKELNFTVDGIKKIVRGEVGEGAQISVNGRPANIHTQIKKEDIWIGYATTLKTSKEIVDRRIKYGF